MFSLFMLYFFIFILFISFLLLHKIHKVIFCCYRKHAFVDLLSEMDLTKALTSNGEVLLDKPMKIAKAKIKSAEKVKVKSPELKKQGKNDQIDLFNVLIKLMNLLSNFKNVHLSHSIRDGSGLW